MCSELDFQQVERIRICVIDIHDFFPIDLIEKKEFEQKETIFVPISISSGGGSITK